MVAASWVCLRKPCFLNAIAIRFSSSPSPVSGAFYRVTVDVIRNPGQYFFIKKWGCRWNSLKNPIVNEFSVCVWNFFTLNWVFVCGWRHYYWHTLSTCSTGDKSACQVFVSSVWRSATWIRHCRLAGAPTKRWNDSVCANELQNSVAILGRAQLCYLCKESSHSIPHRHQVYLWRVWVGHPGDQRDSTLPKDFSEHVTRVYI